MRWPLLADTESLSDQQQKLVTRNLEKAFEEADRFVRKFPRVDVGVARTAAFNGLVQATRRYDEGRGKFWPYGRSRVAWSLRELLRSLCKVTMVPLNDEHYIVNGDRPDDAIMAQEVIALLGERDREFVGDFCFQGYTQSEIADRRGVSDSRVSHQRRDVARKLQRAFGAGNDNKPDRPRSEVAVVPSQRECGRPAARAPAQAGPAPSGDTQPIATVCDNRVLPQDCDNSGPDTTIQKRLRLSWRPFARLFIRFARRGARTRTVRSRRREVSYSYPGLARYRGPSHPAGIAERQSRGPPTVGWAPSPH